jgi:hypothetical protein
MRHLLLLQSSGIYNGAQNNARVEMLFFYLNLYLSFRLSKVSSWILNLPSLENTRARRAITRRNKSYSILLLFLQTLA